MSTILQHGDTTGCSIDLPSAVSPASPFHFFPTPFPLFPISLGQAEAAGQGLLLGAAFAICTQVSQDTLWLGFEEQA